ncbi:MAG: ACP S-malonyltransferase, partial [Pseudomonadota bacterium]|nr:ACP S-malonyltransferase [Pseudomonadota bacterium]
MSRAIIFPGQGSQSVGMGRGLASQYPEAREVFEAVDDALGEKLSAVIWNGPDEELTLTENAQPALMAVSLATFRVLENQGFKLSIHADYVAGHSLGEYSALAASGALTLADTAKLLRIRGKAMQQAVPVGVGAMAALLGPDFDTVVEIAAKASTDEEICSAANDNAPGQVVISGSAAAVARAID